jgi:hypothetical protein
MKVARVIVWQIVLSMLVAGLVLPIVVLIVPAEGAASVWPYVAAGAMVASFIVMRLVWRRRNV